METSGVTSAGQEFATLSPELRLKREELVKRVWRSLPLSSLRGYCGFYRNWSSWAKDNGASQFRPSIDSFTAWLTTNIENAPTAAEGRLSKAKWCCKHLARISRVGQVGQQFIHYFYYARASAGDATVSTRSGGARRRSDLYQFVRAAPCHLLSPVDLRRNEV